MFASTILQQADADKDSKLTVDELANLAEKLFTENDKDEGGSLDESELGAALAVLAPAPRGFGGPGGFGPGAREPGKPGPHVSPGEVSLHPEADIYDPSVLRTLFFEFENADWEAELQDFHGTDVEVPAKLTVDGETLPGDVGLHFRGMSSYMMIPAGSKRSLNVAIDLEDADQRLHGYKTLNLLNGNGDPSLLSSALYSHIARQKMPAPKANFVRVVINGESWGVYANVQQFNKEFLAENYESDKGARWKVSGSPNGDSGLNYVGDDVQEYRRRYEIKSKDREEDWQALIELCRTLSETPPDELEAKLAPILDIDSLLWFLAVDVSLINSDGYWVRASDYSIYRDEDGKFHIIPHDMNEAFHGAMGGPGMGGLGGGRRGDRGPGDRGPGDRGPGGRGEGRGERPAGPGGRPPLDRGVDAPDESRPEDRSRDPRRDGEPGGRPDGPRGIGPGGFSPGGPGGFGGPGGGGGLELDPLVGLDDVRKPLRSRVLAVPKWREQYLKNVRTIAEQWLDWSQLGPVVAQYRALLEDQVSADTRKLSSLEAFQTATADAPAEPSGTDGPRSGRGGLSLRAFADQRRAYLLNHPEIKKLTPQD